jgi:translation initiation factor eIF-2B subunit delta
VIDFAGDRHSGSSDVARGFLEALERFAATDVARDAATVRTGLLAFLRGAQASQPSMALVHQLAARALAVADAAVGRGDAAAALRAELARSCEAERADLDATRAAVARQAVRLLDRTGGWIATLSASATVRDALIEAKRSGIAVRALVGEGRPGLEGRAMAAALAEAGIPVWLVVDAALPLLLSQCTMVWLGADAVTDQGFVNKIGSFATALGAREHSIPVWALAERRKFLPAATGALRILEYPGDEVWDEPAQGVEPRNVYFELVPLALARGIVVEDGVLGEREASVVARERPLPDALAT